MSIESCRKRILEIASKHRAAHLGSCFSCLDILYGIYRNHPCDVIILSNGHAGLAQYCVIEDYFGIDAEKMYVDHGTHPHRDPERKIHCSTGSLGCGLAMAIGFAMAGHRTHCIISDGECAEGIVWESLAFIQRHWWLHLDVHVNMNGFGATEIINRNELTGRLRQFLPGICVHWTSNHPMQDDVSAHYRTLSEAEAASYAP